MHVILLSCLGWYYYKNRYTADMRVLHGSARILWMAWKILFKKYFHWNCLKIYLIFNRGVGLSMIKHETIFSGICLFYSNDVYIDNVISIYFLFIFSQYIWTVRFEFMNSFYFKSIWCDIFIYELWLRADITCLFLKYQFLADYCPFMYELWKGVDFSFCFPSYLSSLCENCQVSITETVPYWTNLRPNVNTTRLNSTTHEATEIAIRY